MVADSYRVIRVLGRGGMGLVYEAEHLRLGSKVAVKVLTYEWSVHPIIAKRFKAESRAASAAGHPNIVKVFDAGELPDARLFLVMEFLPGRSLFEEVDSVGPLRLERACRIMIDVGRALKAAHDVGIIHRDLKPDNVMLVPRRDEETVKVLDFGIAAIGSDTNDERLTRPGHALGTPDYMAPEQAKGREVSPAFDIYAMGSVLYEALTGEPPFSSSNIVEVLARKATEPAPSIDRKRPGLPPGLSRLVHECLEIDPDLRPKSVAEVVVRLEAVLEELAGGPSASASGPRIPPPPEFDAALARVAAQSERIITTPRDPSDPPPARAVSEAVPSTARWRPIAALAIVATLIGLAILWTRDPPPSDVPGPDVAEADVAPADPKAPTTPGPAPAADPDPDPDPVPDPDPAPDPALDPDPALAEDAGDEAATDPGPSADPEPAKAGPTPTLHTPRCRKTRARAHQAKLASRWAAVLREVKVRGCWSGQFRSQATLLKVEALFQSGKFDKCVAAGSGPGTPGSRRWSMPAVSGPARRVER